MTELEILRNKVDLWEKREADKIVADELAKQEKTRKNRLLGSYFGFLTILVIAYFGIFSYAPNVNSVIIAQVEAVFLIFIATWMYHNDVIKYRGDDY